MERGVEVRGSRLPVGLVAGFVQIIFDDGDLIFAIEPAA
jgi:hypothetical protein